MMFNVLAKKDDKTLTEQWKASSGINPKALRVSYYRATKYTPLHGIQEAALNPLDFTVLKKDQNI